jgi:hypothetical protein
VPRFLWLQRWSRCGGRLRAPPCKCIPSPRAIKDIEKKHRHRCLDGYPQTWEALSPPDTGTKLSLRNFSQFDLSTSDSDSFREPVCRCRERGRGYRQVECRTTTTTYNSPPPPPPPIPNLAQPCRFVRNPPSRPSWATVLEGAWELLFEFAAPHSLFAFCTCSMGEEGMTSGLFFFFFFFFFFLPLSEQFICFSKGPDE